MNGSLALAPPVSINDKPAETPACPKRYSITARYALPPWAYERAYSPDVVFTDRQGWSLRRIGSSLGVSRTTIARYPEQARAADSRSDSPDEEDGTVLQP